MDLSDELAETSQVFQWLFVEGFMGLMYKWVWLWLSIHFCFQAIFCKVDFLVFHAYNFCSYILLKFITYLVYTWIKFEFIWIFECHLIQCSSNWGSQRILYQKRFCNGISRAWVRVVTEESLRSVVHNSPPQATLIWKCYFSFAFQALLHVKFNLY